MGSLFTAYASLSTTITLLQQAYLQFIPSPLRDRISAMCYRILNHRSPKLFTLLVEEYHGLTTNPLFEALEVYLCNKITTGEASCLKATSESLETRAPLAFHLAREEKLKENFKGFEIKWVFHTGFALGHRPKSTNTWNSDDREMQKKIVPEENRYFELRFLKIHKEEFFASYLPQVLNIAENIKNKDKVLKIWTLKYNCYSFDQKAKWESVKLNHPSTFDTLALDSRVKQGIIDDLDRFLESKEFYRKVGRAWKRGYLLYGPPGTGKSSLIAAIANYLKFDVYDLQLMHIQGDSMLRKMLLSTMNRSILVIEDIDCSMGLPNKRKGGGKDNGGEENEDESEDENENDNDKISNKDSKSAGPSCKISLSGLLNFIDGLWSSCGDERIIIFTTNHKERIDPALLRPGRMDFHIHMSYIGMDSFKTLASNYLDLSHENQAHPLFGEIEEMIRTTNVTPAEVAEELMKGKNVDKVLEGVVGFLKRKRVQMENEQIEKEKAKRLKKIKKEQKAKEKVLNIMDALSGKIST